MAKHFIATASSPIGGFTSVLPLLALHLTATEGPSSAVIDTGIEPGSLDSFVTCDRLSLTTPVSVSGDIFRTYTDRELVLFNANQFGPDDVFRISLLSWEAKAELGRQARRATALVPFEFVSPDSMATAYSFARLLHHAGFEVRFVSSSLDPLDDEIDVHGIQVVHGSIPPLGAGLVELITRERRPLGSFLANPPAGFTRTVEYIEDWLTWCRKSAAFRDLAAPSASPAPPVAAGPFPALKVPPLHRFWTVRTILDAADRPGPSNRAPLPQR